MDCRDDLRRDERQREEGAQQRSRSQAVPGPDEARGEQGAFPVDDRDAAVAMEVSVAAVGR